jgi:hypothetical protein
VTDPLHAYPGPGIQSRPLPEVLVLGSVRWSAILFGLGVGVLGLAVLSLVLWLVLTLLGVEGAAGAATTFGTLGGFVVAGWFAGRRAPYSYAFHGATAAMGIALAVVVTAVRAGSPAPTSQVLLLAVLAIVLGGVAAHFAKR